MDYSGLICNVRQTVREVMVQIDKNAKGTAFILDEDERVVGIATDGDIRRALLNGAGLNDSIRRYMNRDFVYAKDPVDAQDIIKQYEWKYKIIPLLDDNGRVTDCVESSDNRHIALAQPQLSGNEYNYLMDAFLSTWISSTGKYVTGFEDTFSRYCGVRYGVATSNGTVALHLALAALGIGKGDEVIVPDITFAATINAVLYTGATPVIVDIDESWCMDPDEMEKAITSHTKAVIPVHIYGQPCDMQKICEVARAHGLYIVEDCAEAHGAEFDHKKVGSFGIISCFSFFGNKVITTGEGGMCITDNKELNQKMRILRDHGMSEKRKYYHEVVGFNYRITNMQAAIGMAQLEHIEEMLAWRSELEEKYRSNFSRIEGVQMQRVDFFGRKKIAWLVSVLVGENIRDEMLQELKKDNIDARPFFIPLSEMKIYQDYAKDCKNSKRISRKGINLPTTYDIDDEKIEKITSIVAKTLSERRAV